VIFQISNGSTVYQYWVQNVAGYYTGNHTLLWFSNLFNFSSRAESLQTGDVTGNGSYVPGEPVGIYSAIANTSLLGGKIVLANPATIGARLWIENVSGYPHLLFEYDDGYGWTVWDNVTFDHARGFAIQGFDVDGFDYGTIGGFNDAEWVLTGFTTNGHVNESDLDFALDFWNGHNYEAVPSAWNFGGNSENYVSNASMSVEYSPTNGTEFAHVVAGSGRIGPLYNASEQAVLNVSTFGVTTGTLEVGNASHAYVGGNLSLRLWPGTYPLVLWNGSSPVAWANVTLVAGQTRSLFLPNPQEETVSFLEAGLPAGTTWAVTFHHHLISSDQGVIRFPSVNGSFAYRLGAVPGFAPLPAGTGYQGTVTVRGTTGLELAFGVFGYPIAFDALGLPVGEPWGIALDGTNVTPTTGPSISLNLSNATYTLGVNVAAWFASSSNGTQFTVDGGPMVVNVTFATAPGQLEGTVQPAGASLQVNGVPSLLANGAFDLLEPPGTYTLAASADGYRSLTRTVTITAGNSTVVALNLTSTPSTGASTAPSTSGGIPAVLVYALGAVVLVAVAAVGIVLWIRSRRG
jgi:Thermopsin/PEGA domain